MKSRFAYTRRGNPDKETCGTMAARTSVKFDMETKPRFFDRLTGDWIMFGLVDADVCKSWKLILRRYSLHK